MAEIGSGLAVIPTGGDVSKYKYADDEVGFGAKFDTNDMLLPLFKVLSSSDDEIKKAESRIKGAEQGMFYNKATGELFTGPVAFVISHVIHKRVEWKPMKPRPDGSTGSLVNGKPKGQSFDPENPLVLEAVALTKKLEKEKLRPWHDVRHPKSDNDLVETYYVYGLHVKSVEPLIYTPVVMILFRTKLPLWKKYYGNCGMYRLPDGRTPKIYYHSVKLTSAEKPSQDGTTTNPVINFKPLNGSFDNSLLPPDHALAAASKEFYKAVEDGRFRMDDEAEAADVAAAPNADAERNTTPGGEPTADFFGGKDE